MIEVKSVAIFQSLHSLSGQRACEHAAAETAYSETRGLFSSEHDQLERARRLEAGLLQCTERFERTQNADYAIISACIRNGVDVGTRGDGRKVRVLAAPTREEVADGVFADVQVEVSAKALDKAAGTEIGIGEEDSGDDWRFSLGNGGEVVDLALQAVGIDVEVQRSGPRLWRNSPQQIRISRPAISAGTAQFVFLEFAMSFREVGLHLFELFLNLIPMLVSFGEFVRVAAEFELSHDVTRQNAKRLLLIIREFPCDFIDDTQRSERVTVGCH